MRNKEHPRCNQQKIIWDLIWRGNLSKNNSTYQEALQKSGYSYPLKFTTPQQQSPESATNKRKRQRNMIWFNPPFSKNVQTNLGREFRNLIENYFPPNRKLRSLFHKNNVKLSYSCSPNTKQIIDRHKKTTKHTTWRKNTHETLQLQRAK